MSGESDFSASACTYASRALSQSRSAIACRACWQSASMLCGVAMRAPPAERRGARRVPASPDGLADDEIEEPERVRRCESPPLRLLSPCGRPLRPTPQYTPPRPDCSSVTLDAPSPNVASQVKVNAVEPVRNVLATRGLTVNWILGGEGA